jgi:Ca2+-binding EF-hand superfamily protein
MEYRHEVKRRPRQQSEELIFSAKLVSNDETNSNRIFVVRFSLGDDEIKVWETETDGFRGGFFYRSPHERTIGKFDPSKAFIGSQLRINLVDFILVDAPDSTLNCMESDPDTFPFADLATIINQLRDKNAAEKLRPKFEELDTDKIGRLLIKDVYSVLSDPDLNLNQHQQRTVVRRYRFYQTDRFLYNEFLTAL